MKVCNWRTNPTCPSPDEIANALKQEFKITENFADADLVLPNGIMIDIGDYRGHSRAAYMIWEFLDLADENYSTGELLCFGDIVRISRSPTRLHIEGHCVPSQGRKPNHKQLSTVVAIYYLQQPQLYVPRPTRFIFEIFQTNASGKMSVDLYESMNPDLSDITRFIDMACVKRKDTSCECITGFEPCCKPITAAHILGKIKSMTVSEGAAVYLPNVRERFPTLTREEFDAFVWELIEREKVFLQHHVHEAQMTDKERATLVLTPKGRYAIAIVIR